MKIAKYRDSPLISIAISTICSLIFISLFGKMTVDVEAFEFLISTDIFSRGLTVIKLPPVGSISAQTHNFPVKLQILLTNIDVSSLAEFLKEGNTKENLVEVLTEKVVRDLRIFVVQILLIAGLGGVFGALLLREKKVLVYLRGFVIGIAVAGFLLAGTYYTYDTNKFAAPEYEGSLETAQGFLKTAEEALVKVNDLDERMEIITQNLYRLFSQVESLQPLEVSEGSIKVLHVSDIHNNPAAYNYILRVSEDFGVDAIVDTGDITDYGTPLETQIISNLEKITVPYLFVPGNHDSPSIVEAMKEMDDVRVLQEKEIVEVKGITFMGIHDPVSVSGDVEVPPKSSLEEYIARLDLDIKDPTAEVPVPDVLAVHNPLIASEFAGNIPVIVHGHNHRQALNEEKGTLFSNAGTTGAAGIRQLQTVREIPYSLNILYFQQEDGKVNLIAVDLIKVYHFETGFRIQRKVIS